MPRKPSPTKMAQAGEIILEAGEPIDEAYRIESGVVELTMREAAGSVLVGSLEDGDILGDLAVVDGGENPFTARAVVETRYARVARQDVLRALATSDPLAVELLHSLAAAARRHLTRRHRRHAVDLDAVLEMADQPPIPCRVLDLSLGGARLAGRHPVPTPNRIRLHLGDGLTLDGAIVGLTQRSTHVRYQSDPEERRRIAGLFASGATGEDASGTGA